MSSRSAEAVARYKPARDDAAWNASAGFGCDSSICGRQCRYDTAPASESRSAVRLSPPQIQNLGSRSRSLPIPVVSSIPYIVSRNSRIPPVVFIYRSLNAGSLARGRSNEVKLSLMCLASKASAVDIELSVEVPLVVDARFGDSLDNQREGNDRIVIGVTFDVEDSAGQMKNSVDSSIKSLAIEVTSLSRVRNVKTCCVGEGGAGVVVDL